MKKNFWGIAIATLLCCALFAVGVSAATEGNYTYTVSSGKATITSVSDSISGKVVIPNKLGGYPVVGIGDQAFLFCDGLTNITIPNSVTSIGDQAFFFCNGLTNITIPNSVTSIGMSAFAYCHSLTSITVPNGVTSIGDYAFTFCISLTNITIPSSVTSIGESAFSNCESLIKITIPNSVSSIGDYAFNGCSSLKNITIPSSVTSIGDFAFNFCSSLTNITIPSSVTSIGDVAFNKCDNLTIYGYNDSAAKTYANNNNIPFVALSHTISGTVTSYGTGDITLSLLLDDAPVEGIRITVDNTTGKYTITDVPAGTYTLRITKADHSPYQSTVTVENDTVLPQAQLYLLGDANHDGKADSSDAVAILRNLAGYEVPGFYEDTADFNGDGKADSSDAVAILRKLAGY